MTLQQVFEKAIEGGFVPTLDNDSPFDHLADGGTVESFFEQF